MAPAAGNDGEASTVYLSTSLDTHLVTTVSGSESVSDFKERIMLEHRQSFPGIGNIKVHNLKVKRKGVTYQLSNSIPVKSAFGTTKRILYLSVDASCLEQDNDVQHFDTHKGGDRLALPWVTHNDSINRPESLDNHHSQSIRPKTIPFGDQIFSNVNGDACNDVSRNIEEDRSSDDKQLPIKEELTSRKRTRDVSNENLLKDSSGCELSVKKKRKTQKIKSNTKASEENIGLTYDDDKGKDRGVSMNNENRFEHESKNKDLIGEINRIKSGEKCFDLVQVAAVAPSGLEGVGMFEKEKENELVQKAVMENEVASSSMNVIDSSQQKVGSNSLEFRGDLIDKREEDRELSLKQGPEVRLPERRKRVKKSAEKNKNETLVMHADDNPAGDIALTVPAPILDEKIIGEKNEVLEATLIKDSKKNDEMIVNEMGVSEPTNRNRVHVENMEEKSKNKLKDVVGRRKRKKDVEKTASEIDKSVVKQSDDVATSLDALHVDCVRNDDVLMNNNVEVLRTEKNLSQVHVEDVTDNPEKKNEKVDGVKKDKRKKKTKKSAPRNEDESVTKHVKGDICDNVKKDDDSSLPHFDEGLVGEEKKNNKSSLMGPQNQLSKDQSTKAELESKKSQSIDHHRPQEDTSKNVIVSEVSKVNNEVDITNDGSHEINILNHSAPGHKPNKTASVDNGKDKKKQKKKKKDDLKNDGDIQSQKVISKNEGLVGKAKKNNKSALMGPQDRLSKHQSTEVDLQSEKSQKIDHHHHLEDTSKNVTVSEVSKVDISKNVTVSEVSKVNDKVDITNDGSHEINFLDHFSPGNQQNKNASINPGKHTKKPKKKTKDDSMNNGDIRSQKIISKNESNKVGTDPNIPTIDQTKVPRMTKNIDSESSSSSKSFGRSFHNQKSSKQQPVVGSAKKVVSNVNSLLNTPGKIFGDDDSDSSSADDNTTVNSDSSTQTPSRKSTSSSSSSGESASSIDSRRNRSHTMIRKEGGGKNSMTPQSKLEKVSMTDLLRSSSRFKKAKFSASQVNDTESQPVDFVPDSQPLA